MILSLLKKQSICFSFSLISICLISHMALATFDMNVAETEQAYVAAERAMLKCAIAIEKETVISNLPEAKKSSDLAQTLKKRAVEKLEDSSCSLDTYNKLRDQMEALANKNKNHPYLYSSTVNVKKLNSAQGHTRQDFIKPLVEPFFSQQNSFMPCDQKMHEATLTSPLKMHAFFLNYGYPCTVRQFKNASMKVGDSQLAQDTLNEVFKEPKTNPDLTGLNFALVPHLSYERSQLNHLPVIGNSLGGEKLNYKFLKQRLLDLGANHVEIIYRNSTEDIKVQAEQTFEGLEKLAKEYGEFTVITRSFGAGVINYLFNSSLFDTSSLVPLVKSWVNIGGTPYGSVIADFKSREDIFYLQGIHEGINTFNNVSGPLQFFLELVVGATPSTSREDVERFIDFGINGLNPEYIASMSHLNPDFMKIRERGLETNFYKKVKVFNVVFLINEIANRTESTDPVLQNMMAYGPTEGSAPLYGAAVDTQTSARVFINNDHLVFRNLPRQQAENIVVKALTASLRYGY